MKKISIAVLALAVGACGGRSSNGSGSTGTGTGTGTGGGGDGGSTATVTIQVNLVGAGTGRVTSQPAGIDCPGACATGFAPGTPVTLTAVADANSHFEGYGGGSCSGLSCAFTADATTKPVFANFSPLTVNPVQHTVTVTVAGVTGTVVSTPAGITCPGVCSAHFADGTKLELTATSTAGNVVGWSGACTGSAGCSLILAADAAVTATFSDPCAGLVTTLSSTQPKTFTVLEQGPGAACQEATSDGAGNVYVMAIGGRTIISTSAGNPIDDVIMDVPLQTGFLGERFTNNPPNTIFAYAPNGAIAQTITLPGADAAFGMVGSDRIDDLLEVSVKCDTSGAGSTLTFFRIDAAGKTSTATETETSCPKEGGLAMVDANGNILVVGLAANSPALGIAPGDFAARWFDATAKPLTGWFDAGVGSGVIDLRQLRPIIGGGAALRLGAKWFAIPSGKAQVTADPEGFEAAKDSFIVAGGKAYVAIPDFSIGGTVDVVAANGKVCGALATQDATHAFFVGKDKTLIELSGPSTCAVAYYPQLLH